MKGLVETCFADFPTYTRPTKPVTRPETSQLNIRSELSNMPIIILNKSLLRILAESELKPILKTKNGREFDLIATIYESLVTSSSGKYQAFRAEFLNLIDKYKVASAQTNNDGRVILDLPFGTYYIFTFARFSRIISPFSDNAQKYVWDKEIIVNNETSTASIELMNATYIFK